MKKKIINDENKYHVNLHLNKTYYNFFKKLAKSYKVSTTALLDFGLNYFSKHLDETTNILNQQNPNNTFINQAVRFNSFFMFAINKEYFNLLNPIASSLNLKIANFLGYLCLYLYYALIKDDFNQALKNDVLSQIKTFNTTTSKKNYYQRKTLSVIRFKLNSDDALYLKYWAYKNHQTNYSNYLKDILSQEILANSKIKDEISLEKLYAWKNENIHKTQNQHSTLNQEPPALNDNNEPKLNQEPETNIEIEEVNLNS